MIHIARDRQPLGKFNEQEVADGLRSGRFLPTDLAWQDPMDSWKPLAEFENLPEPEFHDEPPLLVVEPEISATGRPGPAWERRGELGTFPAAVETTRQVYSEPAATFRNLKLEGGYAAPMWYYTLLVTLSFWVAMLFEIALNYVNPDLAGNAEVIGKIGLQGVVSLHVGLMIVGPVFIAGSTFLSAGIFHVMLLALGGASKPYEATYRALCYAAAPAMLFQMMPVCGVWIASILSLVFMVIALHEVQGIPTAKAVAVVLIPNLLCCGLVFGVALGAVALLQAAK